MVACSVYSQIIDNVHGHRHKVNLMERLNRCYMSAPIQMILTSIQCYCEQSLNQIDNKNDCYTSVMNYVIKGNIMNRRMK